jgi:hypothetical protein
MILARRPAKLGLSINVRTERHNDEPVPALDIPLHLMISAKELNELMQEPHTADAWFETGGGELPKPFDKHLAPRKLKGKFESSAADLWFGLDQRQIGFDDCKIARVILDPQVGGMTAVILKIQTLASEKNLAVILWLDRECECELRLGELTADDVQEKLDLQIPEETPLQPKTRARRKTTQNATVN